MTGLIRSYTNAFELVDSTREVNMIPNTWGTINSLGIFENEPVADQTVTFQEVIKDFGLILDRVRGDRGNKNKDYNRKLHAFNVPHFPLDDAIYPKDIQGKSAYTPQTEAETLDGVRLRKMERIRNSHAVTLEYARAVALTTGKVYSPNGTVNQDWFAEFNASRQNIDFNFADVNSNIIGKIEQSIAGIQDNSGMITMTGIVVLTSPEFFAALISHPTVIRAYQFYTTAGAPEPLRNRMAANGSAVPLHRMFTYGGVTFIEMRDQFNGKRLIPANDAYFVPTGTEFFRTYFAPAERFGLVNTNGEQVYMFEQAAPNGTAIEIETESNFANALLKPALVVRGFFAAP